MSRVEIKNEHIPPPLRERNNATIEELLKIGNYMPTQDEIKRAIQTGDYKSVIETPGESNTMKISNAKKYVSLKLGVIGSGQAGGRMAEVFYNFGYTACAINTARQDLEFLKIPEGRKFLINYTLSGSGKDIAVGQTAVEESRSEIKTFLEAQLQDTQVSVLCLSLGGGSGSGSAVPLVEIVSELGMPLVVMAALPGSFDDSQSRFNAFKTLSRLADLSNRGVISSLIIIDNAKIEASNPNLSQAAFWDVSNRSTIDPLHLFNSLTAMASEYEVMDASDLIKAFLESGACSMFGSVRVTRAEYEADETGLLAGLMDKMPAALPADGFNLKEAQAVGILITARKEVLEKIPYSNISYVFKYISEEYDSARAFKGVYAVAEETDDIQISFVFSGFGLPPERVDGLREDAERHESKLESKKKASVASMSAGISKDKALSQADKMIAKVKGQSSAMSKLIANKNTDRRR